MNPLLLLTLYSNRGVVKYLVIFFFFILIALPIFTILVIASDPLAAARAVGEKIMYKAFNFYEPAGNEFVEYRNKFMWPMKDIATVTQEYKDVDIAQGIFHTGIDIVGKYGQREKVLSTYKGTVIEARDTFLSSGYANHVIIDHGSGIQTLYAHLSEIFVTEGQEIEQGFPIGLQGNTGNVFSLSGGDGTHLHFEVRKVDQDLKVWYIPPREFLTK